MSLSSDAGKVTVLVELSGVVRVSARLTSHREEFDTASHWSERHTTKTVCQSSNLLRVILCFTHK